jgi:ankyrin repeat protein
MYRLHDRADPLLVRNETLRAALGEVFQDSQVVRKEQSIEELSTEERQQATSSAGDQGTSLSRRCPKHAEVVDRPLFELDQVENPVHQLQAAISSGANINAGDRRGRTPLDHAIRYEKRWLIRPLLEHGADPNLINNDGESALKLACRRAKTDEDLAIVKGLLNAGADVNACVNAAFATPLHVRTSAATTESDQQQSSPSSVRRQLTDLITSFGADVETRDENGRTGLMQNAGCAETMARYIKAGADVNTRSDEGETPLMRAVTSVECIQLLIDAGASLNDVDQDGRSPLIHAVQAFNPNIDAIEYLLESGADPTIRDKAGMTAGDYASTTEKIERLTRDVKREFGSRGASSRTSLDRATHICRQLGVPTTENA